MLTTSILLILTLLAAIIGTYWNSTSRGKLFLAFIAIFSCSGAMFQSYEDNKEIAFNKRVLEHLIRATEPPEIFTEILRTGIRDLAKRNNLWMHQQEKTRKDIAIFILAEKTKEPGDADIILLLREPTLQNVFLSYVSGESVADSIESSLAAQWGNENLAKNWNDFVGVLTDLVTLTATYHPKWKNKKFKVNSSYIRETQFVSIVIFDEPKGVFSKILFKKTDIQNILAKKLILRDQTVFERAFRELNNIQTGINSEIF